MHNTTYANLSDEELSQIKQLEDTLDNKYVLIAYKKE